MKTLGQNSVHANTLAYGSNTLTATATAPDGTTATTAVTVTGTMLTLAITSPADGASINGDSILVTGTLLAPINTGVTVNGVVANVDNGKFYANNVPLQPGANTLTVIYTTADGTTATQTRSVNSTSTNLIQVTADEYTGAAPMQVSLSVTSQTGSPIQSISVDPGGSASIDSITASGLNGIVKLTYPGPPGTYLANVTVTDALGSHSQAVAITVWDPAQRDVMLQGIYTGMLAKLKTGDINGALTAMTGSAHDKYLIVFNALRPNLSTIADQLGTLEEATLGNEMAEYVLVRNIPSGSKAFLIYFLLGEDGVWRIDGM